MSGLVGMALVASLLLTIREVRIAEAQRLLAAQHFESVRQLADTFIFQVHDAIRELPGAAPARDLLVRTAVSYLDTLAKQAGSDHALQRDLAEAYARLGNVQGEPSAQNTGQARAAVASYSKALAFFEALGPAGAADATVLSEMGTAHLNRSRVLMMLSGDTAAAARESQQAIALLSTAAALKPDDAAAQEQLISAYKLHSYHAGVSGQDEAATDALEKGIAIAEALYRRRPDDPQVAHYLALSYRSQFHSRALNSESGMPRYVDRLHKALNIDERLRDSDPQHEIMHFRSVSADWNEIGITNYLGGDLMASVDALRTALAVMKRTAADTHNAQVQVDIARIAMNLGRALIAAGQLDEAQTLVTGNAALAKGILERTDTLEIQYFLANCETQLGAIEAQRALSAQTPGQQLRLWQSAHTWFEKSVPRFRPVVRMATLDVWDRAPIDDALAGLSRTTSEIQRLQVANETISNR
jgi:tetratricopeptide (TPR) repeat protein